MGDGDAGPPAADGLDLSQIFFSNEEYCRKLEELKKAHLQTMADLESMYQQKLLLGPSQGPDGAARWGAAAPLASSSVATCSPDPTVCLMSHSCDSGTSCIR